MYNTLEIENKFRKSRLITDIHERKSMAGAKPNVQLVKDVIYNWNNPKQLEGKYKSRVISNMRYSVKAIVKQYINDNIWARVSYNIPYNTKGAVCIIQECYDYLVELLDGDINKLFIQQRKRRGPNKIKSEDVPKVKARLSASQPDEGMKVARTTDLQLNLAMLKADIAKYNLTREQIIEQLNKLK